MAARTGDLRPILAPRRAALLNALLDHLVWLILAIILVLFSLTIERFFQLGIFLNILQHATFVGLIAIGPALGALGKQGCGACHETFREKQ